MNVFTGLSCAFFEPENRGAAGESWRGTLAFGEGESASRAAVVNDSSQAQVLTCTAGQDTAWAAGDRTILVTGQDPSSLQQRTLAIQCHDTHQAQQLLQSLRQRSTASAANGTATASPDSKQNGTDNEDDSENVFDAKTDKGSADLYFHYYGMLQHQQNMLQDMTRTGTYHAAITENRADFEGKVVMDVGAGSGILSLFSAQAGAARVYAVEASGMAKFAQQLAEQNPVGKVIQVCHTKVEEFELPGDERVDVLVSEPMGTLLVNERMLETYLYARDHFLKPGGKMFPQVGRIHAAAFSDGILHSEMVGKSLFWQQTSFYGIDMTPLLTPATEGYFAQVVVDAFDPSVLVSDCATRVFDFATIKEEELYDISIPLELTVALPCTLHGIATWFDVLFNGSTSQRWLSTAPGLPTTHWFQLRCCLQQPLLVLTPNTRISGTLRLVAHERQSYDVLLELNAPPVSPGLPPQKSTGKFDMKEPYYRQLTTWATQIQAAAIPTQPVHQQSHQHSVFPNLVVATQQQGAAGATSGDPAAASLSAVQQQPSQQPQQQQQWTASGMV